VVDDGWLRPEPGWVCPECGFDFDTCTPETMRSDVLGFVRRYRAPLTRGLPGDDLDAVLRTRTPNGGWSALEYACHVRDAFLLTSHRIAKAVDHDHPTFRVGDRDAAPSARDYNGQDPTVVVDELAAAAEALATTLAAVPRDGWGRTGVAGEFEISVTWMGCNAIHEGTHHLLDIARALRGARFTRMSVALDERKPRFLESS
jgi:hypothetical protein